GLGKSYFLHTHCRQGQGRTTLFAALILMLEFSDTMSFDDIILELAFMPPHVNFANLDYPGRVYPEDYKEKINFLKHFYDFARARCLENNFSETWSMWIVENPILDFYASDKQSIFFP